MGAQPDDSNFLWLRQLVEWQNDIKDPRVFMHSLKIDLYPDEVYTFTPKGDVFAFPRGATPLDFAYRIHTDVERRGTARKGERSEEHTSELQSRVELVCRLLLEKKKENEVSCDHLD